MIWISNIFVAILLFLGNFLSYVFIEKFPITVIFSLAMPIFIILNMVFLLYWIFRLNKKMLLSFFVLILGIEHFAELYNFGNENNTPSNDTTQDLTIMSYNVRLFNLYNWIHTDNIKEKIIALVKKESPDILCLQEYYFDTTKNFDFYPYKYINHNSNDIKHGQAIFSKYPILDKGTLRFPNTSNNSIYVDIAYKKDTLRIYNFHLQSIKLNISDETLVEDQSNTIIKGLSKAFQQQKEQTEILSKHFKKSLYKKIVCGDLNNTAYSYVYRKLVMNMNDAFKVSGKGINNTFELGFLPLRIDFIFSDPSISVKSYKKINSKYSDHYPIMATFK